MLHFSRKSQREIKGLCLSKPVVLSKALGILFRTHGEDAFDRINHGRSSSGSLRSVLEEEEEKELSWKPSLEHPDRNPNFETYALQLRECGYAKTLHHGKLLYHQITNIGLDQNTLFQNLALQMYGSCGAMVDASSLLAKTHRLNVHSWNTMIRACGRHGLCKEAFQLFDQMQEEGMIPDTFIFVSLLAACLNEESLYLGKHTHARISGIVDVVVGSALVKMYSRCRNFESARQAFDDIRESDVISWTTMISVSIEHHRLMDALQLFDQMQLEGVIPNKFTFVSILDACAKLLALDEGKQIHACIICRGIKLDAITGNALVAMYGQCGSLSDAQRMFNEIFDRDTISWTSMISSCMHSGQGKCAFRLLHQMQFEGVLPDGVTYCMVFTALGNEAAFVEGKQLHACIASSISLSSTMVVNALVTLYGKCGSMNDAQMVFDSLLSRNVVSWTAMIAAYARCGQGKEAFCAFEHMQQGGVMPNKFTLVGVLHACACQAVLKKGKQMHALILGGEYSLDTVIGTALVNMYGKCGSLKDAESTFEKITERDAMLWNAMIATYAQSGQDKDAMQLFSQMQREKVIPNKVTFMSILSAFSHAGLVDDGYGSFLFADQGYCVVPARDHYNCVIGLLSRAGLLNEAEGLIKKMPFQPTFDTWTTLLGACRNHGDVDRGIYIAKKLFKLDAKEAAPYAILSNICFAIGSDTGQ